MKIEMKPSRRALMLWSMLVALSAGATTAAAGVEVAVSQSTRNPLVLDVTLKNATDQTIEVPNFRLPWAGRYSMVVLGMNPATGRRTPLPDIDMASAPLEGTAVIGPGETIGGTINLTERVRGIWDELSRADVTVVWLYELKHADPALSGQKLTGSVILAKGGRTGQ